MKRGWLPATQQQSLLCSGQLILVPTSARYPAESQGGEHVQPRHGGAERSRGGDLRRRRPLGEADPAGAPPADEDVEGGDRQCPEDAVGVAAHRRGRSKVGAGEVGRAHGERHEEN